MGGDEASVAYDIPEVLVLGCDFVWAEFGWEVLNLESIYILYSNIMIKIDRINQLEAASTDTYFK